MVDAKEKVGIDAGSIDKLFATSCNEVVNGMTRNCDE